jgi:hypothetical protein
MDAIPGFPNANCATRKLHVQHFLADVNATFRQAIRELSNFREKLEGANSFVTKSLI